MSIDDFFAGLWQDYVAVTPQAHAIHALFTARDEPVINDHVAFRTFDHPALDIETLEPPLLSLGYQRLAPYIFEEKKLRAWSYLHPDPNRPKLFLSELEVSALSRKARQIIKALTQQLNLSNATGLDRFRTGRPWPAPHWQDYETLRGESEYAAWVVAMGLRVNHFTVSINHLQHTPDLNSVIRLLKQNGFALNQQGGEIKGSPGQYLEQAATVADRMPLPFADNEVHVIPTCYYEFAQRYSMPNGEIYQGFVAANADKLFHSTDLAG